MSDQAHTLFDAHKRTIHERTDKLFMILMGVQWIAGIIAALVISPYTWVGNEAMIHINIYAALTLGTGLTAFPAYMVYLHPGETITRHVVAVGQMLSSALLIHFSGGRIETHFHVFGSLAFLAFYRDWKVIVTATAVVAIDHFVRGTFYPYSVFGVLTASPFRWMEHAAWVIFEDIFLFVAIRQSIAEMKNIAVQKSTLQANVEELRAANEQKQIFIASMSHELRTPLHAILGFSELLEETAKSRGDDVIRKDLQRIIQSGNHLLELINSILDISKIDSGKLEIDLRSCKTKSVMDEVMGIVNPMMKKNNNKVIMELRDDIGMVTDSGKLKQSLVNVLHNASKFCENGVIQISAQADPNDEDYVLFSVRDSGIGMSEEQVNKIFQKFVQIDPSLRRKYEGVGLGLYITREFCKALGGGIQVDSELNEWTEFRIRLPKNSSERLMSLEC